MNEPIIKQLSKDDILNDFWNVHLKEVISAKINILIFENIVVTKGEKETVGEQQVVIGQSQDGRPMQSVIKVKAVDALVNEKNRLIKQQAILDAIEELRKNNA